MQSKRTKRRALFCLLIFIPFFTMAQHDMQTSILSDDGIFTVSQTCDGKDMILFSTALWDDMMKGTKYTSHNLAASIPVKIYIQLTNKKQWYCSAGIGFRCSVFDNTGVAESRPTLVNNDNRICSAMIQKKDAATIRLILLDKVDWNSLQNNGQHSIIETFPYDSIPAQPGHVCCLPG